MDQHSGAAEAIRDKSLVPIRAVVVGLPPIPIFAAPTLLAQADVAPMGDKIIHPDSA